MDAPYANPPSPTAVVAIPDRYRCLKCAYDLSGLAWGPCPECGYAARPGQATSAVRLLRKWSSEAAPSWVFIVIAVTAVAATPMHSPWQISSERIVFWLALCVTLSVPLGIVRSAEARPRLRRYQDSLWVTLAPILHLPWVFALILHLILMPFSVWWPSTSDGRAITSRHPSVLIPMCILIWLVALVVHDVVSNRVAQRIDLPVIDSRWRVRRMLLGLFSGATLVFVPLWPEVRV